MDNELGKLSEKGLQKLQKQSTVTQSILFSKKVFESKEQVIKWLKFHDKKSDNIDETDNFYRARQRDPDDFMPKSFRTKQIGNGIFIIIGKLRQ